MQGLKISLITVVFNAERSISRCIESVLQQTYDNVEYIIIDGASTDETIPIIDQYRHRVSHVLSEPDRGIYDAMNKGIKLATGDIIGMLNADDVFADFNILSNVARAFMQQQADIIYGDLDFINENGRIVRKWRSGFYTLNSFNRGWMPPHPTFYCKRNLFEKFGFYSLEHGTAADYELMLKFMYRNKLPAFYLKTVMVKMKIGGKSNKSFGNRVKALFFDLKAMRRNGIPVPAITLIAKPLRKVMQYMC